MGNKIADLFKKNKAQVFEATEPSKEEIIIAETEDTNDVVIDDLVDTPKQEIEKIIVKSKKQKKMGKSNAIKNNKKQKSSKKESTYLLIFSDKSEGYSKDKNFKKEGLEVLSCDKVTEILPYIPYL